MKALKQRGEGEEQAGMKLILCHTNAASQMGMHQS